MAYDEQSVMGVTQNLPQPFATVILDANGNGIASLGPQRVREHWQPTSAAVSVETQTLEATCKIFMGPTANDNTFLAQTPTGSTGDTCGFAGQDMQTGMQIFAQWIGGDAGSKATVVVNGTYSIGNPG